MAKFFNVIADAKVTISNLLKSKDDQETGLAYSVGYEWDWTSSPKGLKDFEKTKTALWKEFDRVLAIVTERLGVPTFVGTPDDKKFPIWGSAGYRIAYWKNGKRHYYLNLTHIDKEAMMTLDLGAITGPPKNWIAGT